MARGLSGRVELGTGEGMMCGFKVVSNDHDLDREGIAFCEDDDDDTHE